MTHSMSSAIMSEPDSIPRPPQPATSEDIPRAVEYLIQRVLRFVGFSVSAALGLIAFAAYWHGWSLWVVIPILIFAGVAFRAGISIHPRGKIVFDAHGPMIVVPRPTSATVHGPEHQATDAES